VFVCLFVCLKLLCGSVCAQGGFVWPVYMRKSRIIVKKGAVLRELVVEARRLVLASVNTVSITLLSVDKLA
jgi:hypothetical protein